MTTISFTGDIAFSKYFSESWKNPEFIHSDIKDFLNNSDYVVANIESPFTVGDIKSDRPLNHTSNPKAVECLKEINANIWNLSNNHILDCGEKGMADTIELAKSNNFKTLGAGHNISEALTPIIINENGGIGIFSVTYKRGEFIRAKESSPGCILFEDSKRIKSAIKDIKEKNRWCVIIAHGGEEFSSMPLPSIRKRYIEFLDYGADIVVGHHPHVMQNYETIRDKTIFYSLGNFIFDTDYQRIQNYSEFGMLIKFHFTEDSYTWEKLPTKIDRNTQSVVKCETPDIFCDVSRKEYNRLKPLIVKCFFKNNKKARCFSEPECKKYGAVKWFKHYSGRLGAKAVFKMNLSELSFGLGLWKNADKKLYTYLINSVKENN